MHVCTDNWSSPPPSEPTALLTEGKETEDFWSAISGRGPHPFLDAAEVKFALFLTSCVWGGGVGEHSLWYSVYNDVRA